MGHFNVPDRLFHQFQWRHLPRAYKLRQPKRIIIVVVGEHMFLALASSFMYYGLY